MTETTMRVVELLRFFGLSNYEAKVYGFLLSKGESSASEIAENTGIPRTKVYSVIRSLQRKGLVAIIPDTPRRFYAVSPSPYLGRFVKVKQREFEEVKRNFEELMKYVRERMLVEKPEKKALTVYSSLDYLMRLLKQCMKRSSRSMVLVLDDFGVEVVGEIKEQLYLACARGVHVEIYTRIHTGNWDVLRPLMGILDVWHVRLNGKGNACLFDDEQFVFFKQVVVQNQVKVVAVAGKDPTIAEGVRRAYESLFKVYGRDYSNVLPIAQEGKASLDAIVYKHAPLSQAVAYSIVKNFDEKAKELASSIGEELLANLERAGALDPSITIEEFLRLASFAQSVHEETRVEYEYDGGSGTITFRVFEPIPKVFKELAESNIGVIPSIWCLALMGLLRRRGYDFRVVESVYLTSESGSSEWIIQWKIIKRGS